MAKHLPRWEDVTPGTLIPAIEHVQKTFDSSVWKCSEITEKMCYSALHPGEVGTASLAPYEESFRFYRLVLGNPAVREFDRLIKVGTPPAIFKAYSDTFRKGIETEVARLFEETLAIGIAQSKELKLHPADWAKAVLSAMIQRKSHTVVHWIKSVCDQQDFSKILNSDQKIEEFISWSDWRAPKLIYMQPSGNLPYDPEKCWAREDEPMTKKLLDGLSVRFVDFVGYDLDTITGDAHVTLAKRGFKREEKESGSTGWPSADQSKDDILTTNKNPSEKPPRVFISYSWETPQHQEWVLQLATRLQEQGGVQVLLDQWHLSPGQDKTVFMERGVAESDFVIFICTPDYAKKANQRHGGVGYESMIITGELAANINQNKFIPVLRDGAWNTSLPNWIRTRLGVDLSAEPYSENQYQRLLRALHKTPLRPPPIGPKPVWPEPISTAREDEQSGVPSNQALGKPTKVTEQLPEFRPEIRIDKWGPPAPNEDWNDQVQRGFHLHNSGRETALGIEIRPFEVQFEGLPVLIKSNEPAVNAIDSGKDGFALVWITNRSPIDKFNLDGLLAEAFQNYGNADQTILLTLLYQDPQGRQYEVKQALVFSPHLAKFRFGTPHYRLLPNN